MAEQGRTEEKVVVDINQLYAQLALLEQEIEGLRSLEAQLTSIYERTRRARESIDALVSLSQDESILIALDSDLNALASFKPEDKEKVLVNIGLGVYVKMDVSEAQRILGKRESELLQRLKEVSSRISELTRVYTQYQAVLQTALASAMRESKK